ncbi:hypothetical protein INT44_000992 [Umbelopsis vinacea]|uniref:Macro domain-containing protein n=1 Tax=Umbelopsis vinacea TaxID=44442 RepID=A0A8H7UM42_9FUNG|nr:hypothetical protein INT44_000992 [Umbelopsis vinacea]
MPKSGRLRNRHEFLTLYGLQDAKITKGYNLSKYVIHTVGPNDLDQRKLRRCYTKSLSLAEEHGCSSIVFPCIATGRGRKYNTYREEAAIIALVAVRDYVMDKQRQGKKLPFVSIVFCVYSAKDEEIYNRLYPKCFNRKPNYVAGQQNHPVQVVPISYQEARPQNPVYMANGGQNHYNKVPGQQNHHFQMAPISYQEARPQNPVYMANGGQSHYNNVPRQQNHHFQMAPIDSRDNGPQKPHDTTYGDQRYYNNRVAPRDRGDNDHQKPHDATNGDQIYYSDRETNYVPRQQYYPVEIAHVGYRDNNFQKPDTTDGG